MDKDLERIFKEITHTKKRKIKFYEFNEVNKDWKNLNTKKLTIEEVNQKVWNLGGAAMPDINTHLLTLEQAIKMIEPAIDEDGFMASELYIWRNKKNIKKHEEEYYSAVSYDGNKQKEHLKSYAWNESIEKFISENEKKGYRVTVDFYPKNSKGKPERTAYKTKQ